jgi:hypothetical protein
LLHQFSAVTKMSRLKLAVIVIGASATVLVASAISQESGPPAGAPNAVTVTAPPSRQLIPGDVFTFQLEFNRAPQGYGGGKIRCDFTNSQSIDEQIAEEWNIRTSIVDQIELHDGQSIYIISIPITNSMSPGTWKLVSVSLGKTILNSVPISHEATFEIHRSPIVVHIDPPNAAITGQHVRSKITVDFPKDLALAADCQLSISGIIGPGSSIEIPGYYRFTAPYTGPFDAGLKSVILDPNQHSYEISGVIAPDAPSGDWLEMIVVHARYVGSKELTHAFNPFDACPSPPLALDGNSPQFPQLPYIAQAAFTVQRASGFVTPTSVVVTINPSQAQLLRGRADSLRARVDQLERQLSVEGSSSNRNLLLNNVQAALNDLDQTETVFKEKASEPTNGHVDVFFDDIRADYGTALETIGSETAQVPSGVPRLLPTAAAKGKSAFHFDRASIAVLNSLRRNAVAYDFVADSLKMTITLDVYSDPVGATVTYCRRGHRDCGTMQDETDSRIEGMDHAFYFIDFHKDGYKDCEKPFDGATSTSTSIMARLEKKADCH